MFDQVDGLILRDDVVQCFILLKKKKTAPEMGSVNKL